MQKSGHGPRDGGALNEVLLLFEDILGIGIETEDETCRHPKTLALDEANALQRITPQVLKFLGFRQGLGGGAFDADEDIKKVRLHHGFDQFGPLREINRCLGVKQ